jgi:hypothetical protein
MTTRIGLRSLTSHRIALVCLTSFLLIFTFSLSPIAASAQPSALAGNFLFYGTSAGSIALGAGTVSQTSQVNGAGAVLSSNGRSDVLFTLTGTTFCSGGPPPGLPCLGLQGTVKAIIGQSINNAKIGDPVVVLLVQNSANSGSICIILPAPGLSGTCDNFVGKVVIP